MYYEISKNIKKKIITNLMHQPHFCVDTVDGWNLANHLGCCWNHINNGISTTYKLVKPPDFSHQKRDGYLQAMTPGLGASMTPGLASMTPGMVEGSGVEGTTPALRKPEKKRWKYDELCGKNMTTWCTRDFQNGKKTHVKTRIFQM